MVFFFEDIRYDRLEVRQCEDDNERANDTQDNSRDFEQSAVGDVFETTFGGSLLDLVAIHEDDGPAN